MSLTIYCGQIKRIINHSDFIEAIKLDWINASILYLQTSINKIINNLLQNKKFQNFPALNIKENRYELDLLTEYIANGKYDNIEILIKLEKQIKIYDTLTEVVVNKDIDYKLFKTLLENLSSNKLSGLYWWVFCSDSKGYLTPGQSYDMMKTLELIASFMKIPSLFTSRNNVDILYSHENYFLFDVLEESLFENSNVVFC